MNPYGCYIDDQEVVDWFVLQAVGLPENWKEERDTVLRNEGYDPEKFRDRTFPYDRDQYWGMRGDGFIKLNATFISTKERVQRWGILEDRPGAIIILIVMGQGFTEIGGASPMVVFQRNEGYWTIMFSASFGSDTVQRLMGRDFFPPPPAPEEVLEAKHKLEVEFRSEWNRVLRNYAILGTTATLLGSAIAHLRRL